MINKVTGFVVLFAACSSVFAENSNNITFNQFNEEMAFYKEINSRTIKNTNYQKKNNEIESSIFPFNTNIDEMSLQSAALNSKAQITSILKKAWRIPNGSSGLKATALFKLRPNGTIERISLTKPSDSKTFNGSIKALKKISGLPVPNNLQIFNLIQEFTIYFGPPLNLKYLVPPNVIYPERARLAGTTGETVVHFLINVNGLVEEVAVQKTSGSVMLDRAAVNAVKNSLFKPYIEDGIAKPVYTSLPIVFSLEDPK